MLRRIRLKNKLVRDSDNNFIISEKSPLWIVQSIGVNICFTTFPFWFFFFSNRYISMFTDIEL